MNVKEVEAKRVYDGWKGDGVLSKNALIGARASHAAFMSSTAGNLPHNTIESSDNSRKRERLFDRQNGVCLYCDNPLESAHRAVLDHINPRNAGGPDALNNRALVHQECDALKGGFRNLEEVLVFCQHLTDLFINLRKKNIC